MDIAKQIDNINKSLEWIRNHHPEQYETRFLQLVECRKVLKNMLAAEENNPGIAAFGKSQVGKSYMIGCLLQDNGTPFLVKAGSQEYDFVKSVNPPSAEGGGRESTGVVSRFSSFKRNPKAYSAEYPVLVKSFSLTDIIIMLADDYFNDFRDYKLADSTEIDELCNRLHEMYSVKPFVEHPVIGADDVLYMKDYFTRHINNAHTFNSNRVAFFDRLALIIDRVPIDEYLSVFSNIWDKDVNINRLYTKLFGILKLLGFARYIYLPIEAVLHEGVRENTIMSVQCLTELFSSDTRYFTDAYTREGDKMVKRAANMPKSQLCAICSEVVFHIEESFLSSSGQYDFAYMDEEVKSRLSHQRIQMSMLRDNDLLDFPGARTRVNYEIAAINENSALLYCFLRSKVAYLFNKYNDEMGINILLYCHHNKDSDVPELFHLLQEWVHNYVGPHRKNERRSWTLRKSLPYSILAPCST